ncbi:CHAT domain-containing protein [Pseudorhodoferax sp.]|uniref:CHAT domain-containing protein n=1 Tax=Pseudorhodoferax sp. TaxID=1993553 RepID=UPI002DD66FAE|nr:CHAT domain-containing protein [Pseudorhodoferax sp.]
MTSVGPQEFNEEYGGDFERLKTTSNALRIYKYSNKWASDIYWIGCRRYDILQESEHVFEPILVWIQPDFQKELQHPDEILILSLGRFLHEVGRFAGRAAAHEQGIVRFDSISNIREECREWEYRTKAKFPARHDALHTCGESIDRILSANPFLNAHTHDSSLNQIRRLERILNYLYYDVIDLRNSYRERNASLFIFERRAEEMEMTKSITARLTPEYTTILVLAANPRGTDTLRLGEEIKRIEQSLERSKLRDSYRVVAKLAITGEELRRALLDNEPEVVHFCGHGSGSDGLVIETDQGDPHMLTAGAIAGLFDLCSEHVRCVVLNACFSAVQSEEIGKYIDYVVGMSTSIGDQAAIKFSVGFYDAIGAGKRYDVAFNYGCNALDIQNIPELHTPKITGKLI